MINSKTEELELSKRAVSVPTNLWKTLCRSNNARIGFTLFLTLSTLCFIGPFFIPHSYETTQLSIGASAPSAQHLFGTDVLGRDLLIRTLVGGQISIFIGFLATAVALIIGTTYGMIAGYVGKKTDALMMRFVDTLYALPFTIMVILLMVLFGRSLILIFLAIGAVEWLTLARIVRGETRNIKTQAFVQASEILGLPHPLIFAILILRILI